jgi:hypothetical protein
MAISTTTTTPARPATPATTIKVQIKKGDHGWTIEPENSDENNKRFENVKHDFKTKREARHQKKDPDHTPIVFNEGDTLTFTCMPPLEFAIGAKKDEVVDKIPDAPDDPFGWNGMKTVPAHDSVSGVVTRSSANGPGVKDQAFYKFHGWVMENGSKVDVDPDGYCGS